MQDNHGETPVAVAADSDKAESSFFTPVGNILLWAFILSIFLMFFANSGALNAFGTDSEEVSLVKLGGRFSLDYMTERKSVTGLHHTVLAIAELDMEDESDGRMLKVAETAGTNFMTGWEVSESIFADAAHGEESPVCLSLVAEIPDDPSLAGKEGLIRYTVIVELPHPDPSDSGKCIVRPAQVDCEARVYFVAEGFEAVGDKVSRHAFQVALAVMMIGGLKGVTGRCVPRQS